MPTTLQSPPLFARIRGWVGGFDGPLALFVALLAAGGLLIMFSAGFDHGTRFRDHGRNMLIAATVMVLVAQLSPQRLQELAVPLYVLGVVLLVAVEVFGVTKKGAQRWLDVGVDIQPSELLKIGLPMMLAWWFQSRDSMLRSMDYLVAALILFVPVALIFLQPDLGTAILVLTAGLSVLYFAGLSWRIVLPPLILCAIGIGLLVYLGPTLCADGVRWPVLHNYQQQRVCTLLDPARDPLGKGFHIIQGMIAIGSGGLWGKGFMQGTQTHLEFIPERTTDFIFATFAEEFGLAGNLVLMACFIGLIWRGLTIAAEASNLFSRLLAGAISMIFFAYAFVNMGMVSGILPVVGVPLPFISYGGTAMLTLGVGIGMLMSISKARRLVQS
jgi:rod shape determining protein RodA